MVDNKLFTGQTSNDKVLDQSEVQIWLDMSNQQIATLLIRDFQATYRDFSQGLLKDCNRNPQLGNIPIRFRKPVYGSYTPSYTDFAAPGVLLK